MAEIVARKRELLADEKAVDRVIHEMALHLRHYMVGDDVPAIVGIRTRGLTLAERLRDALSAVSGETLPLGILDITLYRDDLSTLGPQPIVGPTDLPFDVNGRTIVLCDDVIFTGRTVRAALEALIAFGRPRAVRLAVLVDRGHREYPVQPDVVGMRIETTLNQIVKVHFAEIDGENGIDLVTR